MLVDSFGVQVRASKKKFLVSQELIKTFGGPLPRSGPLLRNKLPLEIRNSQSLAIFKFKLKTHLFKLAYNLFQHFNIFNVFLPDILSFNRFYYFIKYFVKRLRIFL